MTKPSFDIGWSIKNTLLSIAKYSFYDWREFVRWERIIQFSEFLISITQNDPIADSWWNLSPGRNWNLSEKCPIQLSCRPLLSHKIFQSRTLLFLITVIYLPCPRRPRILSGLFISVIHRSTTQWVRNGRVIYLDVFPKLLRISGARHVTLVRRRRGPDIWTSFSVETPITVTVHKGVCCGPKRSVGTLKETLAEGNAWRNSSMFCVDWYRGVQRRGEPVV